MKFESKYNIGDRVVPITRGQVKTWVPCGFCSATGRATGADGSDQSCPKCYGLSGEYIYESEPSWHLADEITSLCIGDVQMREGYRSEERYMAEETGIGNGTIWDMDKIFPSKEAALEECEKRNKELNGDTPEAQ